MPSSSIRPYENLTSFRHPRDLRRTKDLTRYDHNRKPLTPTSTISTSNVYYSGDRVRFNSKRPPEIPQIASSDTYGFDLNEYEILLGFHDVTVRWQDGTTTTSKSTRLTPYSLPESDLCPGDLVLSKEGLRMTGVDAEGTSVTSDFNEMSFFERNHILVPAKVGIIQSVDAQERLARVRWYASPKIELGAYGHVLQRAQFGKIGDDIEDVSLYEIMTEPALIRKLGDVVVVPPQTSPKPEIQHSFPAIPPHMLAANPPGPTTLSYLRQLTSNILPALWEIARPFADLVANIPPRSSPVYDWIGEIVEIGLHGSLTVRLGSLKQCKDVILSQEDVLLIIDEDAEYSEPIDDSMDVDANEEGYTESRSDGSSNDLIHDDEFAIDEIIEYEGGERLDNESGEDEWSTDDDTPQSSDDSEPLEDISMSGTADTVEEANTQDHALVQAVTTTTTIREADASENDAQIVSNSSSMPTQPAAVTGSRVRPSGDDSSKSNLVPYLAQENAPSAFEVLEQLPPPDQYNQADAPTNHTAFLKRIAKEHKILASSLPDGEIYVRTYESRLDLLRCLIVGPADTPYEYCPFVIDLHLGPNFPNEPPKAHFHSWTSGLGRINPNLYEEGKICLSLLGTWSGQNEQERWNDKATILQILVSLQGLVFVSRPFYNEAGFETYDDEKVYSLESQQYSEKAYVMARGFAKYALLKAPSGLEHVIAWLYLSSRKADADKKAPPGFLMKVISRAKQLMDRSSRLKETARLDRTGDVGPLVSNFSFLVDGVGDSTDETKTFLKPLSQGALVMLKKTIVALEDLQRYYNSASTEGEQAMDVS
jgi:ubiquitin-conjugating enzyme E2 O